MESVAVWRKWRKSLEIATPSGGLNSPGCTFTFSGEESFERVAWGKTKEKCLTPRKTKEALDISLNSRK